MDSTDHKGISKKTQIKLVYPAQQFELSENPRPDGSLGLLYLAGVLRDNGYGVSILDMCVGDEGDELSDTFYRRVPIDDEHIRVGMPVEAMLGKVADCQIVGVTSIFTPQTLNCFEVAKGVKEYDTDILTVAGGGNARALYKMFLDNGFDIVVFGEGEETMLEIAESVENGTGYSDIQNVAYKRGDEYVVNPERPVLRDLDQLPFPAWDMLPLNKYWQIGEPHGGTFEPGSEVRYLSMQTSRGCPFRCEYCHISKEGDAAKLRFKSIDRVMAEVNQIKELGAQYLFFEDDSLLAKKERIKTIFRGLKDKDLKIIDVNGVNLAHFFMRDDDKNLVVDVDLLDLMMEVGWTEIAYPFESGNQRILDRYASGKWNRERHDVKDLVKLSVERGLKISGFFTIGYPDESYEELTETFLFAKDLVDIGLQIAAFYIIVPYPGSVLYDYAAANNHLPEIPDLPNMKFAIPTMINTKVPPEVLHYNRRLVYQLINRKGVIEVKHGKNVGSQEDGVDIEADLAKISGRDMSLGVN
jgi:anaerobic magnesium-protoporphyrin IX monomethyl ester cyclase